jgi:hypothetical protein
MRARDFSDGFAEPILWGARHAFSVVEIAEGLGLREGARVEGCAEVDLFEGFGAHRDPSASRMSASRSAS